MFVPPDVVPLKNIEDRYKQVKDAREKEEYVKGLERNKRNHGKPGFYIRK